MLKTTNEHESTRMEKLSIGSDSCSFVSIRGSISQSSHAVGIEARQRAGGRRDVGTEDGHRPARACPGVSALGADGAAPSRTLVERRRGVLTRTKFAFDQA